MNKALCILLLVGLCSVNALSQVVGNRNYGQGGNTNRRPTPSSGVIFGSEPNIGATQFVEAYVLLNAQPEEFVAMFGVAQEAPAAVESNQKVNTRIEQFLSATDKLGVSRGDIYVDFITQNRVYNYVTDADGTVREKQSGFETKKTVSIRYKDKTLLEKLLNAAAQVSIFDLIKVDYVISDMTRIRSRLFEEAASIIKQKEATYTRLFDLKIRRKAIYQETYDTFYPAELYQTYNAFESGAVDNYYGNARVIRERKSSTSFLEPLDRSMFDAVINPIGIEPLVQCTLYMKVMYTFTTPPQP